MNNSHTSKQIFTSDLETMGGVKKLLITNYLRVE